MNIQSKIYTKSPWGRNTYFLFALMLMATLASCQKYLDIQKGSNISLISTANDCQLLLDNYALMNTGYPSDGEASADDYYLDDNGYLLADLRDADRDIYTWSSGAIRPGAIPQWESPYQVVYQSNLVLEAVEKIRKNGADPVATPATLDALRGQALFFRSFAFWQVAQLYCKPYSTSGAPQDPGIPLRLVSDINDKSDRGTVAQTYGQIVKDLREAVALLPATSVISSRPNRAAAYALLARSYLSMEDYPAALGASDEALKLNNQLQDYNSISKNSSAPFIRFNKEVIFHSVMAPHLTLRPGTANSPIARIDPSLVSAYSSNDLRGSIFLKQNNKTVVVNGNSTSVPDGTYRFSGNYEPATTAVLFDGLAVDEMYLIRAEGYARAGNTALAMADLNTLLRTRWATGTYTDMTAANADDALAKILSERRKELLMRGLRWSDLRRLNKDSRFAKTMARTLTINGVPTTFTLPPNDLRYTLLIPDEVIKNSPVTQNPR